MKEIIYKTEEERLEALRKMVGMRKVFEARAREIYEKNTITEHNQEWALPISPLRDYEYDQL